MAEHEENENGAPANPRRRALLKLTAYAAPIIVSTVVVEKAAAQASCTPNACPPDGGPCSPDGGGCGPDSCNPRA